MTPSLQVRDQLQRLRSELADLRQQRAEQRRGIADLRDAAAGNPTEHAVRAITAAQRAEDGLSEKIEQLREQEAQLLHGLAANGAGARAAGLLSDQLLAQADDLRQIAHSNARLGGERLLATVDRETVAGWFGRALAQTPGTVQPTPGMHPADRRGAIPYPSPPTALLDLVPAGTTDQSLVEFAAELRSDDTDVGVVAPGALKPQLGIEWEDRQAASATVAGWVKVNRQSLADVANLQALVQTRLFARLRQALEREVLSGDGTVSDRPGVAGITGLLKTSGVASIPAGAGGLLDAVVDGIVAVLASGGTPNALAVALTDWAEVARLKDDTGAYVFAPAELQQVIWGLTMTPTVALEPGTAIVADTRAMQVLVREPAQIRIGEEQDDMSRNRLSVLAETRAAFVCWQPSLVALIESNGNGNGNGDG